MTANVTTAFWSMTINNPDERDLALVRNGYGDYCRELIHTLEVGEEGTPHIQAWVKLQRQQRMSFMRKLFPGGHFKPLTSAEYVHNTKLYAQKEDETTAGAHVHIFHDPTDTIESVVKKVGFRILEEPGDKHISQKRLIVQKAMVTEDYRMAKMFVSATYRAMWNKYEKEIVACLCKKLADTHTHTHIEEESSVVIDTTDGEEGEGFEGAGSESGSEVSAGDDYEDSATEASEGSDEGCSSEFDEEDDSSESGE